MSVYDGMMEKLGGKVTRMRPMPVIKDWQNGCVPGDYVTVYEEGEPTTTYTLTEDPAWEKVDKLIVKALDAMKKRGVKQPLSELQEAAFRFALGSDDRGLQLFAWRLVNTRHFVEEWGRIRKVASGKQGPRETDQLFFGGGGPRAQTELLGNALRVRGILKAKQE